MKYIAYSVYGHHDKYNIGAVRNAESAKIYYPGWEALFYVASDTPKAIIEQLESNHVTLMYEKDIPYGKYWRFLAYDLPHRERLIVRDTDSRLSVREIYAVDEWIESGKLFHSMRDHPHHNVPIMGGMWGASKKPFPAMRPLVNEWIKHHGPDADQEFMSTVIWPLVKHDCLQHDAHYRDRFAGSITFPTVRENQLFVGEIFDEKENRNPAAYNLVNPHE